MKKKGIDKNKIIKIIVAALVVIILVILLWFLYFYPNKVFRENEKLLEEAGIRYYEINDTRLPKEEDRVISVSLNTLVKQKYLDGLYEAYGNKLCDLNESNVKAVNKDGDYTYYTYLKCGKRESSVDHEGPVITLSGDTTIKLNKGDVLSTLYANDESKLEMAQEFLKTAYTISDYEQSSRALIFKII